MTTFNFGGFHHTDQLDGLGGATITETGIGNSGIFAFDHNSTFIITGLQNSAAFITPSQDSVFIQGVGNHVDMAQPLGDFISVSGAGNEVSLSARAGYAETGDTVVVNGVNNQVSFFSGSLPFAPANDTIDDRGFGTTITIGNLVNLTVQDFAHDFSGKVNLSQLGLAPTQAAAMEQSDGHGGTLIVFGANSSIDFLNDSHVSASHFV